MATPRQGINNADKFINKELFGTEDGDVKRDNNALEKKLKRIKDRNEISDENETIALLTRFINANYIDNDGSISRTKAIKDEDKNLLIDNLSEIFQGDSYHNELRRFSRYGDYRIIDEYIAEISDGIDVLRDSIMSPDDISKKSTLYTYDASLDDETQKKFETNMTTLFEKYNFQKFVSEKIRAALVLGDGFTVVDSMGSQFSKYLNEDYDPTIIDEGVQLNEDSIPYEKAKEYSEAISKSFRSHIDPTYLTEEIIGQQAFQTSEKSYIEKTTKEVLNAINKNVKFVKDPFKILSDSGKYDSNAYGNLDGKTRKKLDINGVHLKKVEPDDIIKLEIDHIPIGYLYINKVRNSKGNLGNLTGINPTTSMLSALTSVTNPDAGTIASHSPASMSIGGSNKFNIDKSFTRNGNTALEYDLLVDMLITGISQKLDNKFIEKNESVRDLLLALVKTDYIIDKEIEITFLEPEKVHHIKLNSTETYGHSAMKPSLFYAKLYLSALITAMMVKINQGRDKRVFYVDVDLDEDVEGNIERLIRDIRSNELPADLFSGGSSITTVLNSVGSLDNFYIPTVNGERAFDIDILSGVDVDIDDQLLEELLKSAVSGLGVPYTYIDATNDIEFARSLSMQNQGFVKKIINYQEEFGTYFTNIVRKMYEYEFGKTEHDIRRDKRLAREKEKTGHVNLIDDDEDIIDPNNIQIKFPEPVLLSVTTSNEQIESTSTTIDYIASLYLPDDDEDNIRAFKKKLAKDVFLKNLDWDLYDLAFRDSKKDETLKIIDKDIDAQLNPDGEGQENEDSGGSMW